MYTNVLYFTTTKYKIYYFIILQKDTFNLLTLICTFIKYSQFIQIILYSELHDNKICTLLTIV